MDPIATVQVRCTLTDCPRCGEPMALLDLTINGDLSEVAARCDSCDGTMP